MVSIKDVAAACKVSVATVSKALNGHSDISAATRDRVCRTATEMGYMPNSAARALKTNRTYNLGVLFVDEAQSGLTHEYFAAVLDSFKREAERRGYDITFLNRNIGDRPASYLEHCRYRGLDGVVAACIDFTDPDVAELIQSNLPTVTLDHAFNNRSSVFSDNAAGMQMLVTHLAELGHKRIAYIHGETHSSVTERRLAGFYKACDEQGLKIPDEYVRPGLYRNIKSAAQQTGELLMLPQRPTAILYQDDFSAAGGLAVLRDAGLSIPDDISIVGYDGSLVSTLLSPRLTTYGQNTALLGRTAAEILIRQIENPRTTLPEQRIIQGNLLPGGTTAPPRSGV